jgi:hypothetical protein
LDRLITVRYTEPLNYVLPLVEAHLVFVQAVPLQVSSSQTIWTACGTPIAIRQGTIQRSPKVVAAVMDSRNKLKGEARQVLN